MIARAPVTKAELPAAIPASMVRANAGLAAISAKIVLPAGTELYKLLSKDVPMINKIGIATISPIDHFPNLVLGVILKNGLFIFYSSQSHV